MPAPLLKKKTSFIVYFWVKEYNVNKQNKLYISALCYTQGPRWQSGNTLASHL